MEMWSPLMLKQNRKGAAKSSGKFIVLALSENILSSNEERVRRCMALDPGCSISGVAVGSISHFSGTVEDEYDGGFNFTIEGWTSSKSNLKVEVPVPPSSPGHGGNKPLAPPSYAPVPPSSPGHGGNKVAPPSHVSQSGPALNFGAPVPPSSPGHGGNKPLSPPSYVRQTGRALNFGVLPQAPVPPSSPGHGGNKPVSPSRPVHVGK
ncbi:formin-like protein 20 [Hibiscus syriacus]|uniref:formin-like protein 20 n=1 Tax=Hibiscus syriacus TaxID=106335 RepID=UPI0019235907|nr:formin-like protein 20 [Hibiscus syriacus]